MLNQTFYEIKTPAAADPVLFAAASEWCRDIDAADTALVNSLISAATDEIEKLTNRVFEQRTFTGKFKGLCESIYEPHLYVEVERAPLVSVTSVKVNGVVLDSADYIVKEKSSYSRILFKTSHTLDEDLAYPIEIEFVAGYATVPNDIITAIKQTVLFWYENRGDVSTDGEAKLPLVTKTIIKQYRILAIYG